MLVPNRQESSLFHSEKTYISNPYLYLIALTISTIVNANILHPIIYLSFIQKIQFQKDTDNNSDSNLTESRW